MDFVRSMWLVLCISVCGIGSVSAATSYPVYGAPYTGNTSTVAEAISVFWVDYSKIWGVSPYGSLQCGYVATYMGNGTTTNTFASVTVNGDCQGTGYIYGTAQTYPYNPAKNNGNTKTLVGDPINSATGNKYSQEDDYVGNAWLTFRRFYNSSGATNSTAMGQQWRHSFDRTLAIAGSSIVAFRPDGKYEAFTKANGVWSTDPDVNDALIEDDNAQGVATSYTVFVAAVRQFENYTTAGVLQTVTDETGNGITLSYSNSNTSAAIAPLPGLLLTVTDPEGRQLSFTYNSIGNVSTVKQPDGGMLTYTYDTSGSATNSNLLSVQYPDGMKRQYVYNESSLITSGASLPTAMTGVVDEAGVRYANTAYNANGLATSTGFMSTPSTSVGTTQVTYNSNGTSTVQYPLGTSVTMGYTTSATGLIQTASLNQSCGSDCDQLWQTLTYDANSNPQSYTDFNGNVTATTYDSVGLLTQKVEAQNQPTQRTTTTTWNTTLRVPLSRTVLDVNSNTVASSAWVYNTSGQPTARCEIDPSVSGAISYVCGSAPTAPTGVRQWSYTYCTAVGAGCPLVGLRLTAAGPRGDLTRYSYYPTNSTATGCAQPTSGCHQAGDLYQVTDALHQVTTYASYDGAGRVTRITDPNLVNTDMTYTARGWLATRTVGGAATSFTYWPYGAVKTVTDPDAVTTTFTYDGAHRLTDITDMLNNDIHYTLDAAGNKTNTQIKNTAGTVVQSLTHSYNTLGQLTAVIDGLNNTVFSANASGSYDANGNLVLSSDAFGIQRKQGFDALNRLTTTIANYNGTDPLTTNTQTTVNHDALNRVNTVIDPSSLITGYTYDGLSNLTKLQSPDTGTSGGANGDTYDAAGNLTLHTDARGVVTQYTYDLLNRLTGTIYPAHTGLNVTYTYDQPTPISGCPNNFNIGHLTTMTDASGTTAWCYTNQGDVREVKQVINGFSYLHGYAYSAGRRLLYLQYPSGFELEYGYDTDGRVTTIGYLQQPGPYGSYTNSTLTPLITAVSYKPYGPVSGYSWAQGGQSVTRTYDQNYALTDITSAGSPQPLALHFARDTMGRIGAEGTAPGAVPASESYQYDPLNRLKELDDSTGTLEQGVTYNSTGDRLSQTLAGQSPVNYGYQAGTHQLTSVGTAQRLPDANGNTTAMIDPNGDLIGLGYDDRNLLTTVTRIGSTIGTYQYNGLGVRVWRTITSPSTGQAATVYDPTGTGNLYGEYFTTDYREYVYLDGIPVAAATDAGRAAPGINYLYADHLGSVRAIVNPQGQGNYQWPWLNNAFGASLTTGTSSFYTRFPGQYYDVETGLMYNGARYYDPSSSRYLQSDPIGLNGGISTYAYVGNDPLSHTDPRGLAVGDEYKTIDSAGVAAVSDVLPASITQNTEYAGVIYQNWNGTYSYTAANPGTENTSDPGDPPWFHTEVADYHTHGADDEDGLSELFSPADIQGNDEQHILGYLGTPRLAIKKYDPCSGKVTTLQIGVPQ